MHEVLQKIIIIAILIFLIRYSIKIFSNPNITEGLKNNTNNKNNGIASNASAYATAINDKVTQLKDALLIDKYKDDYEESIMNLDELIDIMLLKSALSVNPSNDSESSKMFEKISQLNQCKMALNSVMKYLN